MPGFVIQALIFLTNVLHVTLRLIFSFLANIRHCRRVAANVGHQRRRPQPLHPAGRQVHAQGEHFKLVCHQEVVGSIPAGQFLLLECV